MGIPKEDINRFRLIPMFSLGINPPQLDIPKVHLSL
jgi:hypothetical protein